MYARTKVTVDYKVELTAEEADGLVKELETNFNIDHLREEDDPELFKLLRVLRNVLRPAGGGNISINFPSTDYGPYPNQRTT